MTDETPKGGDLVVAMMQDGPNFKQGYSFANALFGAAKYEALNAPTAASPSLEIEGAILARDSVVALLRKHGCYLSDENDQEIDGYRFGMDDEGVPYDNAYLAIRTCRCGERIDGFDEYLPHLIEVFGER